MRLLKIFRFLEEIIDKNKEGVLAFVSNNGYLDNPKILRNTKFKSKFFVLGRRGRCAPLTPPAY